MSKLSYKSLLIIFFFLLISIVILWKFVLPKQKVSASWWNDNWHYRKAISVINTSGSELTDFQVSLSVGTSALITEGKMQSDCDDIRVTDINGNLLPYWIEENNPGCNQITDTKIWIKASSLPTSGSTVYLYYGNSTASNNENGKDVFLEFDDFNNSSTINNWTLESNPVTTYSIAGGTMAAIAASGDYSSAVFGSSYTNVIVNSRFTVNTNQSHGGFIFRGQTAAADNSYQWLIREGLNDNRIQKRLNSGQAYLLGGSNGIALPSTLTAGNWYPIEFRLSGTQVDTYFNNQQAVNGSFADTGFTSGKVGILSFDGSEYFDYFFVRKYASTIPTSTLQSEEVSNSPIAYWKFDNDLLPNNYTPIEYVTINNDSTNSYLNSINTNTLFNNATKIEFTINSTDTVSNIVLVSGYSSSTTRAYPCVLGSSSYVAPSSFTTATLTPSNITRSQVSDGTTRTFTLNFNTSSTNPISFGSWQDSGWSRTINWYSFKIWNGNVMVKNFVPAKRNSDSVFGFYDTINNVFYTNAGTGNFTGGNEIIYDSIGINNGTLGIGNSAPTWSDESQCTSGKCLSFDGTNDTVSVSNINNSDNFTASMWVYPKSNNTFSFFEKRTVYGDGFFIFQSGGIINFDWGGSGTRWNTGVGVSLNQWSYVTFIRDTSGRYVYINGKLVANTSSPGTTSNVSNLNIGWARYMGPYCINGLIDDVKLYPYARTATQIKQDYNSRGSSKGSSVNLGVQSSTAPSLSSKLVAHWKFDEGSGSISHDSSGNNKNGTLAIGSSSPTWNTNGHSNKALNFDGNDSITLANEIVSTSSIRVNGITYSAWIKPNNIIGTQKIVGQKPGSGYSDLASGGLDISSGKARMIAYDDNIAYKYATGNTTLIPNQWYLITGIYNPLDKKIKIYVNGKFDGGETSITTFNRLASNNYNLIGSHNFTSSFFNGLIDEVKIYNTALTDEEIKQDYNQGSAISFGSTTQTIGGTTTSLEYCIPGDTSYCAPPIAEWKMDERTGTSAYDTSGNNNTGTFATGNSAPTWTTGKIGAGTLFDGAKQFITINDNSVLKPTTAITVESWFNTSNKTLTGQRIVSKTEASGYQLSLNETSVCGSTNLCFVLNINGSYYTATYPISNLSNNLWYHVAGSYDGNTVRLFLNGSSVGTTSIISNTITQSTPPLCIGSEPSSTVCNVQGGNFSGKIDHIKIYNYARTPAQIAYDYNKGEPIIWLKLDECQGSTAFDSSGLGNTGAIIIGASGTQNSLGTCQVGTSAAWTAGANGKFNSSLNFDGTDDYIRVPFTAIGITKPFTMSSWFKTSTSYAYQPGIVALGYYPVIVMKTDGKIRAWWYNGVTYPGIDSIRAYNDGLFHHATLTYDGTTAKLYIDGNLESSIVSIIYSIHDYFEVGLEKNSGNKIFNGQIDDARLYNYALTSEQIKTVYNNGAVNFN